MLVISPHSWHFRIYSHWQREIAHRPPQTINLCHYMRAIMIYVPAYYVLIGLVFGGGGLFLVLTSPIWGPFWVLNKLIKRRKRQGHWEWRRSRAVGRWFMRWLEPAAPYIAGATAILALVVAFVALTLDEWWKGLLVFGCMIGSLGLLAGVAVGSAEYLDHRKGKQREREPKVKIVPVEKSPSLFSLMWQWIKAKKKKICPIIQPRSTA